MPASLSMRARVGRGGGYTRCRRACVRACHAVRARGRSPIDMASRRLLSLHHHLSISHRGDGLTVMPTALVSPRSVEPRKYALRPHCSVPTHTARTHARTPWHARTCSIAAQRSKNAVLQGATGGSLKSLNEVLICLHARALCRG